MKNILIQFIRGYKRFISPVLPASCRYYPTCSTYMIQAVERHGAAKGFLMGSARILRCNPFARPGVDDVPENFSLQRNPDVVKKEE